ncbi:hypothetical protein [Blastopirellula retiformator]|uniref:Uncharacterized protein n=1 Tax=Blastopirellula retiformator TaxID=2527970 RepID=A0A5C5V9P7_9BACT|nr:hypothetical protein [Blastopirellula retiformator]TWT34760.1 hypothetical protein Enr8_21740 [Blastopirellula retiformator]
MPGETHFSSIFQPAELRGAVEMQRRSYWLLRWMASGVVQGMVHSPTQTVHRCTELPSAVEAWIREHYFDIP